VGGQLTSEPPGAAAGPLAQKKIVKEDDLTTCPRTPGIADLEDFSDWAGCENWRKMLTAGFSSLLSEFLN
jgi:hypothetical protein